MSGLSSMDRNRIIYAVNDGRENPFPNRKECVEFYNSLAAEKMRLEKLHPEIPAIFSLCEPDEEEETALMEMLPDWP